MLTEKECYDQIIATVKPEINAMYKYFQTKNPEMEEEDNNPEEQLQEMIDKKYLSITFMTDLVYISSCYYEGRDYLYKAKLREYKTRVKCFLEG